MTFIHKRLILYKEKATTMDIFPGERTRILSRFMR